MRLAWPSSAKRVKYPPPFDALADQKANKYAYAFLCKRYICRMNSYKLASLLAAFLTPFLLCLPPARSFLFFFLRVTLKRPLKTSSGRLCTGATLLSDELNEERQGRTRSSRSTSPTATINDWTRLVDIPLDHSNYLPACGLGLFVLACADCRRRGGRTAFALGSRRGETFDLSPRTDGPCVRAQQHWQTQSD